mgnify:CR=1 FL=1
MLVSLEEAKSYLRVDTSDEDAVISGILASAGRLCADVARLNDVQWTDINSGKASTRRYTKAEMLAVREILRVAILYTLGYLYEHREDANHHDLMLTLRSMLFAVREGVYF